MTGERSAGSWRTGAAEGSYCGRDPARSVSTAPGRSLGLGCRGEDAAPSRGLWTEQALSLNCFPPRVCVQAPRAPWPVPPGVLGTGGVACTAPAHGAPWVSRVSVLGGPESVPSAGALGAAPRPASSFPDPQEPFLHPLPHHHPHGPVTEHHGPGAQTTSVLVVLEAGSPGSVPSKGGPPGLQRGNSDVLCSPQGR